MTLNTIELIPIDPVAARIDFLEGEIAALDKGIAAIERSIELGVKVKKPPARLIRQKVQIQGEILALRRRLAA